jgi:hypothetical protein
MDLHPYDTVCHDTTRHESLVCLCAMENRSASSYGWWKELQH